MPEFERFPENASALVVAGRGGIGGAIADALEAHGRFARVLRTARNPGSDADVLPLDLTSDASIEALARTVQEKCEALHLVIICAGLLHDAASSMRPEKRLKDLERAHLHASFDVNAVGPLMLARALGPLLPRREHCVWGTLSARVGSITDNGLGGWYAYRGAKAAQNMFTRSLAIELGRRHRGLACVALHPGTVATGLSEPFRSRDDAGVLTPQGSAEHLLGVVDTLTAESTGRFYAWDGEEIPW